MMKATIPKNSVPTYSHISFLLFKHNYANLIAEFKSHFVRDWSFSVKFTVYSLGNISFHRILEHILPFEPSALLYSLVEKDCIFGHRRAL